MIGLLVSQVRLIEKKKDEGADLERLIKCVKIRLDNHNRGRHTYTREEIEEYIDLAKRWKALYQDENRIYVRRKSPDAEDYPYIKEMMKKHNS